MRKIAFLIVLCCLMPVKSWAWRDNPAAIKAVTALFHNLTTVQKQFAEFAPQHSCHPDVYIPLDIDADGVWEIWVRTYDGKNGILYAQAKTGGLKVILKDSEYDDVAICGNEISVTTGKYAGVTERQIYVMHKGKVIKAPFVEQTVYNGMDGTTKSTFVNAKGKPASKSEMNKVLNLVFEGPAYSKQNFFDKQIHELVNECGEYANISTDITISERPIFVEPKNYAKNEFVGIVDSRVKNPEAYTKMVFKPHINDVKFTGKNSYGDFLYRLTNPSASAKMFRGYKANEATAVIVKDSWLTTHNPLQFSRWKFGEAKQPCSQQWIIKTIKQRFNREVKSVHWLASVPESERQFFVVIFHPNSNANTPFNALASIVCFAEGELISSYDFWGHDDGGNPSSVWNDGDGGYFFWPELTVIAGTDSGLEIYLRRTDSYGARHYCIREIGNQFIRLSTAARYRNN